MNPFQSSYFERLRDWKKLRDDTKDKSLEEICENIDKDSNYEISINALIGNTPINAQLNKTFYNR